MKKIIVFFSLLTLLVPVSFNALAVNEKECAIWLCLPAGFPSGCSDAHSAMMKRIKKKKNPLPSFGSCLVQSPTDQKGSEITAYQGLETEIIAHKECVQWASKAKRKGYKPEYCQKWIDIPHEFKLGGCPLPRTPVNYQNYCKVRNMAQVYENKEPFGDKFYW